MILYQKIKETILNNRKYIFLAFVMFIFAGFFLSGLFDLIVLFIIFLWITNIILYKITPQTSLIIAFFFFILAVISSTISNIVNIDKLTEKTISYFFIFLVISLLQNILNSCRK